MRKSFLLLISILVILSSSIQADESDVDPLEVQKLKQQHELELNNNMALLVIEKGELVHLDAHLDFLSVAELNLSQLKILRNTIVAKYGYKFKSSELHDHFKKFAWYSEKYDNVDNQLNKIDKWNIKLILEFEKANPYEENIVRVYDLRGIWHIMPVMPAGWARNFRFYKDGRFEFIYNTMRELPLIHSFSGQYKVSGNELILSASDRTVWKHNNKITYDGIRGHWWNQAKLVNEKLPKIKTLTFPISKIKYNKTIKVYKGEIIHTVIKIGGIEFYKFYDDPDDPAGKY